MIVLLLIFFGLLQLALLFIARETVDYAVFRSARSAAVGFSAANVNKEFRVKAIPASGAQTFPADYALDSSPYYRYYHERQDIKRYMEEVRWIEYEYWYAGGKASGGSAESAAVSYASAFTGISRRGDTLRVTGGFRNYPMRMPFAAAFVNSSDSTDSGGSEGSGPSMDLQSTFEISNHAAQYTE